jgi:hypothetical protein
MFVAIFLASQVPAVAGSPTFTWRQDTLPLLTDSISYTAYGTPINGGGCTFTIKDHAPATACAWVVRQLAVDFSRCVAITEEGVPGIEFAPAEGDSHQSAPVAQAVPKSLEQRPSSGSGHLARPLMALSSGYAQYWYTNAFGTLLTKTEADITWSFDGYCVTSTSGGGSFTWDSANWTFDNNGSTTADYSCPVGYSYGNIHVYGSFHGKTNTSCYEQYWPATAQGSANGVILYGYYSVSANCFGGYFNQFKYSTPGG